MAGRERDAAGRFVRRGFGVPGGGAVIPVGLGARQDITTTEVPEIISAIKRAYAKVAIFIALRIDQRLIATTPVDTGWARASWICSVGTASLETGGARPTAHAGGISTGPQEAGMARVAAYQPREGVIFISNNVPYIMMLNAGHSAQAPLGFVENAVDGGVVDAKVAFSGGL